jgi:hypothetical protein
MASHTHSQLVLSHKNGPHILITQEPRFFFAMSTYKNMNVGIQFFRDVDHAPRARSIWSGNHKHAGSRDMCLNEYARVRGISRYGMKPRHAQLFD